MWSKPRFDLPNRCRPGLGHEYETVLAISPLQKLLTYARGEVVLTGLPNWAWRAVEEWLVPLAEGLGYKVRRGGRAGSRALVGLGWGQQVCVVRSIAWHGGRRS